MNQTFDNLFNTYLLTFKYFFAIILIVLQKSLKYAKVAQLVECNLAKVDVAGSSPVFRSILKAVVYGDIAKW